jgi:hypothetical protein
MLALLQSVGVTVTLMGTLNGSVSASGTLTDPGRLVDSGALDCLPGLPVAQPLSSGRPSFKLLKFPGPCVPSGFLIKIWFFQTQVNQVIGCQC